MLEQVYDPSGMITGVVSYSGLALNDVNSTPEPQVRHGQYIIALKRPD